MKDIGSLSELVTASGGGLLYRHRDELISAMDRLRLHPPFRRQLAQKGYEAFLAHWEEEQYVENYFKLIGDIEEKKHSAAHTGAVRSVALEEI